MFTGIAKKIKAVFVIFIIKYPIYFMSGLFARNSNRWIFGSLYGFKDNAKYLFLNVVSNCEDIDAVYLLYDLDEYKRLKKLGLNVCYSYSLTSLYYLFTSKVYIGTHGLGFGIPRVTSRNAYYIELWHGIPLKKMGYIDKFSKYKFIDGKVQSFLHKALYFFTPLYIRRDLFVMTSVFVSELFQKSFNMSGKNFINTYYPRCDVFFWSERKLREFVSKYEAEYIVSLHKKINRYTEIFLYMPTFRDNNPNFLANTDFDFEMLDNLMQTRNSVIFLKFHPNTPDSILESFKKFPNLVLLPNNIDVYTLLPKIDVLITDYSSIYIDFILNKQGCTIFFTFDYYDYVSHSRELAFDYNKNINGVRANTFEELLVIIEKRLYDKFDVSKQFLLDKFWGQRQDKVNLVDAIKNIV